jgi:hypothetical protein
MSLSSLVLKAQALSKNELLDRVVKTVVEVIVAQATLYTTVVPNPPSLQTSGAVAGGAGLLSLIVNGIVKWAGKSQAKKLDALQKAINEAAAALNAAKAAEQVQAPKPA